MTFPSLVNTVFSGL